MSLDDIRAARRAESTRKAYRRRWRRFLAWCQRRNHKPLPAEPRTIAEYIATFPRSPTARAALVAICSTHTDAGYPSPWHATLVSQVFEGIHALDHHPVHRPAALHLELVRDLLAATPAGTLRGLRDRAAMALSFAAALRISELRLLSVGDVVFHREGAVVFIRYTKTGPAQRVPIVSAKDVAVCPIRNIHVWLDASRLSAAAPLFCEFREDTICRTRRAGANRLREMLDAAVERAKLPPAHYTWHSFRAGLITTLARAGLPEHAIMRISRHRTHSQVRGYIRDAELFRTHPLVGIY